MTAPITDFSDLLPGVEKYPRDVVTPLVAHHPGSLLTLQTSGT